MFIAGSGGLTRTGSKALSAVLKRDQSLHGIRTQILTDLREAQQPVVVLIDELDRVEDDEIRTVAQLVRAVMDFPSVSFLLAYDHERVADALESDSK